MSAEKRNLGIDLLKLIFACLIPLLHIPFESSPVIFFAQQYLARLGVPFFFAAGGYFLSRSLEKRGPREALKHYTLRIGKLLGVWLAIYFPLILVMEDPVDLLFFQKLLFLTPAYLWYLRAILVAAVPFCLLKPNAGVLVLYVLGALFGQTYAWFTGGWPSYEVIFLTTRNGIFFGLPMMYVGRLAYSGRKPASGKDTVFVLVSSVLLFLEVLFVRQHNAPTADCSMYLLLPVVTYGLLRISPMIPVKGPVAGVGTAIYLMQHGIITVARKAFEILGLWQSWTPWVVYLLVLVIPVIFYRLIRGTKLERLLF